MKPNISGETKAPELFIKIVEAHLPKDDKMWYTTDRLLKETLDAYKSLLFENEKATKRIAALKKQNELLHERIEKAKLTSETYKNLFIMAGGKTA